MSDAPDAPHRHGSDAYDPDVFDLLELEATSDAGHFRLAVDQHKCTPFHFLYGGTGIASAVEAAERTVRRPLQWITTQFIGSPAPGDVVDLRVVVVADGRSTTQTQVFATVEGEPMFTSLAAHNVRPSGDALAFRTMPDVPGPEESRWFDEPFEYDGECFFDTMERRIAAGLFGNETIGRPQDGVLAMWVRVRDHVIGSAAAQAFVADIGPLALASRRGSMSGATSLDNTMRIVDTQPTEWVLCELDADGFHRSVGHSTVRLWASDGRLLSVAQQSAIIRTSHHVRPT